MSETGVGSMLDAVSIAALNKADADHALASSAGGGATAVSNLNMWIVGWLDETQRREDVMSNAIEKIVALVARPRRNSNSFSPDGVRNTRMTVP
jgi:hypothetical protein